MRSSLALLASALILQGFSGSAWSQAQFQTVATFPQTPGYPLHGTVRASDGIFYGISRFGGTGDAGALYKVNDSAGTIVQVANFASIGVELGDQRIGLAADDSGGIYGIANFGGPNGDGALWHWSSAGGLLRVASFDEATVGENPRGSVVLDAAGAVYGVCEGGGAYGDGTLWKWSSSGGLVRLYSFRNYGDPLSLGGRPKTVAIINGVLYGTTAEKDNGTGPDIPVLWSRSATGTMRQAAVFNTDTVGYPQGEIVVTGTGVAGIAYTSATLEDGTPRLWHYPGTGTAITVRHTFATTDDHLTIGSDGDEVYGTTSAGRVWHWSGGTAFSSTSTFNPATLGIPSGSIVVLGSGELFGTAVLDTDGSGSFWKWDDTNGTTTIATFAPLNIGGDPNGVHVDDNGNVFGIETIRQFVWRWSEATGPTPQKIADVENPLVGFVTFGGVVGDDDGNVFGFTKLGAAGNAGVLWCWNAQDGLTKVGTFGTTAVPGNATGHIARDRDTGTIWGTTEQVSGTKKIVHLWRWTKAAGLKHVHTFDAADGQGPVRALTIGAGNAIYGVCAGGGAAGKGTLWAWIDGSGFNNLADFGAPTPITTSPGAGLAVTQVGTVYGVTDTGGSGNAGRIWRWVPVLGLTVVKDFTAATTGAMSGSDTGMIVASDGALYGCAAEGGANGVGTFWKCTVSGTPALTAVQHFDPTVMAHPQPQRLVQADDGMIYGIAQHAIWRYGVPATGPFSPVAITLTPSYLSATRATVEGSVNARDSDTTVTFEFGEAPDALSQTIAATPGTVTGNSATAVEATLTGLDPATTYYYRIKAVSSVATAYSDIAKLKTSATVAPLVVTKPATSLAPNSLTLNAAITPKSALDTTVTFEIGSSSSALTRVIAATPSPVSGTSPVNVSANVTGLLAHTKYFFRARAANDNGNATGTVLFATTTNNAPDANDDRIAILPSATVDLNVLGNDTDADSDTLTVASVSTPPSSAGTVTKTSTGLRFTAKPTFTGATLTYTISDGFGGTSSATVTLTRGAATLSAITNDIGSEGGTYGVDVTTASTWAVWETATWVSASPSSATGNGTTFITVLPNPSATARIATLVIGGVAHTLTQFGVQPPTVATPNPLSNGRVGAPYSISIPTTGRPVTYSVKGTMPPGLSLTQATGVISGVPTKDGDFPLTVRAINAAATSSAVDFTIHIEPLPSSCIGSFFALLDRGALNGNLGGTLKLDTLAAGSATGTLRLDTRSYSLTGRIVSDVNNAVLPYATFTVKVSTTVSLTVTVNFDQPGTNKIQVAISQVGSSNPPLAGLGARNLGTTLLPAGNYTSVIEPPMDATAPQGDGYNTFKLQANNSVSWSGKLADGTAITGSGVLSPDNEVPVWQLLYTSTGCLHGRAAFAGAPTNLLSGSLTWWKKPQASGRSYKTGFGPLACTLAGGLYTAPASPAIVLGLPDSAGNARLEFSQGGIESAAQFASTRQIFRITTQNKAVLDPAGSATNLTGVTLTLNATTGFFSGGFKLRDSNVLDPAHPYLRDVKYEGLLVPSIARGAGFFLLNQLPSSGKTLLTSDILSGLVVLDAAP